MCIHYSSVENGMGKKYEYFINWDISSEHNAKNLLISFKSKGQENDGNDDWKW